MTTTTLKCHDLSIGGFLHWFSVKKPAEIFALRTRQGALKQRFASIKGLYILQALDNVNGFGCWIQKKNEERESTNKKDFKKAVILKSNSTKFVTISNWSVYLAPYEGAEETP